MGIEVRPCASDELPRFFEALGIAFGDAFEDAEERFGALLERERTLAAFDDGRIAGTSAAFGFDMTVPGGNEIATAGVTMVGVLPTHRRRGIMRTLMRGLIDDARARHEPAALLWASEESIYQRFGFGLASDQGRISIERERSTFLNEPPAVGGTRLVDTDEAVEVMAKVYEEVRTSRPGMLSRTPEWWRNHTLGRPKRANEGPKKFYCVFSHEGRDRGYAIYRITEPDWTDEGARTGTVRVQEMAAVDPVAYREVWRYLFGIDLVDHIKAWFLPADLPLTLMMQEPRRLRFAKSESLWLRLVDVPAALEARSYDRDGELSFAITDEFCPWNDGEWTLTVRRGRGKVTKGGDPQIALDVSGLAAIYLGAFTFAELARAARLNDCVGDAVQRADRMFNTDVAPWCAEVF